MAYKPILNDVLEARFVSYEPGPPGQVGINRVRYAVTNIVGAGVNDGDICTDLDGRVAATYKLLMGNRALYRGVILQRVYPLPRTFRTFTTGNAGAGVAGADLAPTQTSGLLKVNADLAGRPFRGRVYVPFPAALDVTSQGNVSVGYVNNLTTLFANMFLAHTITVGVNSTQITPVIFHPKGYGRPPVNINTWNAITAGGASTLWATERRRGNYGRAQSSSPI